MKNKILIVVEGGVVQNVLASDPDSVEITIRDFDTDGSEDENLIEIDGEPCTESEIECEPLD